MATIPCAIVRGGTTKGIFVLEDHLPVESDKRDRLLLALMGSPDARQIDGLGGADPLTSKVAIVSRSHRSGIDVEYESVEVGIATAQVNHGLMCGNLLAGVGFFALAEGLIKPRSPMTTVTIYCRSNQKTIVAQLPAANAPANATVGLRFNHPGGAITGKLLPAGEPVSLLVLGDGATIPVSIVDAGTLYAFVQAQALGLTGHEDATTLDANTEVRATIEELRMMVAESVNRYRGDQAAPISPRRVKMAMIAPPDPRRGDADVVARIVNAEKVHKAYAVSGAICLAAAATIPGTLVNEIFGPQGSPYKLRIGHPSGTLALVTYWSADASGVDIQAMEVQRSARIILRGTAYVGAGAETLPPKKVRDSANLRPAATSAEYFDTVE
jgi:2-methylaconitate cis-trans-isomerase PrpF